MVGIVSYGAYIPRYRIKVADIARAWGKDPDEVTRSIGVFEKSVAAPDEDAVTLAVEAARDCVGEGGVAPESIGALFVGSESHPYAVKPSSTMVGELLGLGTNYLAADLEFACKAGTAGIQMVAGLVASGQISYGLAIGSDTAQSRPQDALEYAAAAAAGAFVLGKEKVIAELLNYSSYSSDTPDFWRREGEAYPEHAGRFTGEPGYFAQVVGAAKNLLAEIKNKHGVEPAAINQVVFHMPNGKFPKEVSKRLGFSKEQLATSLVVGEIGNPYSASSLVGLAAVLDVAKAGELIFMVSYGSGAGSDAFLWRVTEEVVAGQVLKKQAGIMVREQIGRAEYIDYLKYLQFTHKV